MRANLNSPNDVRIIIIIFVIVIVIIIIIIIIIIIVHANILMIVILRFVFPCQPYLAEIFILDEQQVWVISACPPSKYAVKPRTIEYCSSSSRNNNNNNNNNKIIIIY